MKERELKLKGKSNRKSHTNWSWMLMVTFLTLSILDYRFGILGFVCMGAPMYHALRKRGKVHCSHYCPRGSILGNFLKRISFHNNMPQWLKSDYIKNGLLVLMIGMFTFSLYHANAEGFHLTKTGFATFRFMGVSLIIGTMLGVFFKPRSWCQICPMGHATGLIDKAIKN